MGQDYRGIQGYAINAIDSTPEVRDNPDNADMIKAIRSGDSVAGIAMANKILQRYGITKEQALQRAFQVFGFNNL